MRRCVCVAANIITPEEEVREGQKTSMTSCKPDTLTPRHLDHITKIARARLGRIGGSTATAPPISARRCVASSLPMWMSRANTPQSGCEQRHRSGVLACSINYNLWRKRMPTSRLNPGTAAETESSTRGRKDGTETANNDTSASRRAFLQAADGEQ